MIILALDTASAEGGVALFDRDHCLASLVLSTPSGHVAALPDAVSRCLDEAGLTPAQVDLIAVTIGPGSFSGVRIALGFAKGWHLARGTPVKGLTTLEVQAFATDMADGFVVPIQDARRGELFAAVYRFTIWEPIAEVLVEPGLWSPADFLDHLHALSETGILGTDTGIQSFCLTGNGVSLLSAVEGGEGQNSISSISTTVVQQTENSLLSALAVLAGMRFEREGGESPDQLVPLYIRKSEAESNREKRLEAEAVEQAEKRPKR
ncbi:MAG: tRNA (adenosine(37)-N6)-threonylcarbamoyltransferase complex dimerization subunit type 1 TsaB [Magnetococcales bacterium]|nr:tRNA (adenosine(37)-N6)-threonylcarbamoyltransferase complex dimerization subunit type 1 TsaB [Magnetococcales bacterium]